MRLFTASLATETNTFSPVPTGLGNFEEAYAWRPGEHPDEPRHCTAPLYVGRRRARQDGFTLIEGSCFWAEPSGTCARAAYEAMRDEILDQLAAAMPLDGVLLGLHGAMVADGYDDTEGDILERTRAIVGPDCVIGVALDPHCHMTEKRVRLADVIICYKEYPHTDFLPRADELLTLVLRTIRKEIRPVASLYDCRMIAFFPTTSEPTRSFVDRMTALEGHDGVLTISLAQGFSHADVPDMGTRVLLYTDNAKAHGDALATVLGREVVAMRGRTAPRLVSFGRALALAASTDTRHGPVVINEPLDNAGSGAASDNTLSLRELIRRGVRDVALGPIWDPQSVRFAHQVGLGARLSLRIGGKTSPLSGRPVDTEVEVVGLCRDGFQSYGDAQVGMGDMAALRIDGRIDVVCIEKRTQAFGLELFGNVGIDPRQKALLVVKSAQHFQAGFAPIASRVIAAATQGPAPRDYSKHHFTKLKRPLYPLDADAGDGFLLL